MNSGDATRDEISASLLLPLLIPRTTGGLPKLAVSYKEAAELAGCSVDTLERIPVTELPFLPGKPRRIMLADLIVYLERRRRVA